MTTTAAREGRLLARPAAPTAPAYAPGTYALEVSPSRDALLRVPEGYRPDRPAPLVVALHGAGGDAKGGLRLVETLACLPGAIVLAPASRAGTWDVIAGGIGPDVALLDAALTRVFERHAVDPGRVAIAGFSDGASYAVSLGLANGELFSAVLAFSPGFAAPPSRHGAPRVFISHGTEDRVLPIARTSRLIAPLLEASGLAVEYREFHGGHAIPAEIARTASEWLGWRA
jgi:phospholipase/carboxylesterase